MGRGGRRRVSARMLHAIVSLLGLVAIILGAVFQENMLAMTILISVGASLLATAIVFFLNIRYQERDDDLKNLMERWGLSGLYRTKAEMNQEANAALAACRNHVDIMGEGLSNYRAAQGEVLLEKLRDDARIRIVSCDSDRELRQRAKDESSSGMEETEDAPAKVRDLAQWAERVKREIPGADLTVRYHGTYPGFSYLKIDGECFVSPNLWFRQSQQSFAISFTEGGEGERYFSQYFEKVWASPAVHEACALLGEDTQGKA